LENGARYCIFQLISIRSAIFQFLRIFALLKFHSLQFRNYGDVALYFIPTSPKFDRNMRQGAYRRLFTPRRPYTFLKIFDRHLVFYIKAIDAYIAVAIHANGQF